VNCVDRFEKKSILNLVGGDLKPGRSLCAFRRPLFAVSFLTALLYLLRPGPLLIADEQDARESLASLNKQVAELFTLAKLSSLNKQVAELYQVGKFNEAIPIAQASCSTRSWKIAWWQKQAPNRSRHPKPTLNALRHLPAANTRPRVPSFETVKGVKDARLGEVNPRAWHISS
jgi:hypothetical protein